MRPALVAVLLAAALAVTACGGGSSSGSDEQENGPIALSYHQPPEGKAFGIFLREPNGKLRRLTSSDLRQMFPTWSHDGERIAFLQQSRELEQGLAQLFIANADGSDAHQVGDVVAASAQISWAPGDDALAFVGRDAGIWTVRTDGSGLERVYGGEQEARDASWSPDGDSIVAGRFGGGGVALIELDRGGVRELTHPVRPKNAIVPNTHSQPAWSPDGERIAFVQRVWLPSPKTLLFPTTIEIINADGTGRHTLTRVQDESSVTFSWSPDGRSIAFTDVHNDSYGLWVIGSGGGPRRLLLEGSQYAMPSWGPRVS